MNPLVIIPTYNERDNVAALVDAIFKLPATFSILFVDDNSPDGTARLIEGLQTNHAQADRIHLLSRPKKLGLGSAYRDGFAWALRGTFDPICQMDADFSHDPTVLALFLKNIERADLVLGSRYIPGGDTVGWPWHRNALSRGANIYARILTRSDVRDLTGGFKCYQRRVLQSLSEYSMRAEGYAFQIETTTYAKKLGFLVAEIPITFKDREKGKSKLSRKVVFEAFFTVLRLAIFDLRKKKI